MKATVENITEVIVEAEVLGDTNEMKNDIPLSEQGIDSLDVVNVYLLLEETPATEIVRALIRQYNVPKKQAQLDLANFQQDRAYSSCSSCENSWTAYRSYHHNV